MRKAGVFLVAWALVPLFASCQEPTQVVIEARTNVSHRAGIVTSFTVGSPGQTENGEPTTEVSDPWTGSLIGTLVVVPGTADDAQLAVKLVMGVSRGARECRAPDYQGCIVARRRLRYAPNERLRLPIALYAQCENVACTDDSTCNAFGLCVSANVEPGTCDSGDGCRIPGDDGQAPNDAGPDGPKAATDAGDAMSSSDASSDADGAGKDGAVTGGTPGVVDCKTTTCNRPAQSCCFDHLGGVGTCALGGCPPQGGTTLEITCDGHEDCPAGESCCWGSGSTYCGSSQCVYGELCHSTNDCLQGGTCTGFGSGYYRSCEK